MDKDLISINIVAYNAEKTLSKTLESIKMQQDIIFEIIFVNDKSSDSTLSIMQKFQQDNPDISCKIIVNEKNLGITKSRNIALQNSIGNYIAIIDSDDEWIIPTKLRQQLSFLKNNPEYFAVGTQMNLVDNNGKILKTTNYNQEDKDIRKKILISNQFAHSTILMKKPKEYNESLYIWEDYDLFLSIGLKYKFANLPIISTNYLYSTKKHNVFKKIKLTNTEIQIIKKYKKYYPNFCIAYLKRIIKNILILLHLK